MTARASARWASRRCGLFGRLAVELGDGVVLEEGKEPEQLTHLLVGRVEEELVHGEGAGPLGVQPDRARLGLAVLGPVRLHDQRRGEAPDLVAADPADVVDAHGDVAPLVAPAELDVAAVVEVEPEEVVGLEQHVAELGVGDALVRTLEAALDGLLGHHLVDREVLAHVAEVLEGGERASASPHC